MRTPYPPELTKNVFSLLMLVQNISHQVGQVLFTQRSGKSFGHNIVGIIWHDKRTGVCNTGVNIESRALPRHAIGSRIPCMKPGRAGWLWIRIRVERMTAFTAVFQGHAGPFWALPFTPATSAGTPAISCSGFKLFTSTGVGVGSALNWSP